jgi:DNA-binding response OmpR family regulator
VLVVEDDPSLRALYQKVLTLEGYLVLTAADGVEALRRADGHPIDAVILDLALPPLGGRDVKRKFAAHAGMRDVPVIVVTGAIPPDVDPEEFDCVLHKPVSIDALTRAVRECLETHGVLVPDSSAATRRLS